MSLESHLRSLVRKHQALDMEIAKEARHPGVNSFEMRTMKKRKLKLKEAIERRRRYAS